MRELTVCQMSEMDGREGFFEGFIDGLLCGGGIAASFAIPISFHVVTRWTIYLATIGACGKAFFD